MVSHVIGTLFPVYAILALGAWLRRAGFIDKPLAKGLNRIMFNVALPCMVVQSIAAAPVAEGWGSATLALALGTVAVFAASWLLAPVFGISAYSRPSFCQSAFRSNNAYIGIPVMGFAFAGRPDAGGAASLAMLTLAPCLILYNVLAVAILTKAGERDSPMGKLWRILGGMARNPLIIAAATGLALLALRLKCGIEPPAPVMKTVESLGKMATPGSILALGASMTPEILKANLRGAHWTALMKLVAAPLAGLAFSALLGLPPMHRFVVVCYLACPSAVASFVMAQAMDGDADLAGSSVALTTIYSAASLALVVMLAMPPLP